MISNLSHTTNFYQNIQIINTISNTAEKTDSKEKEEYKNDKGHINSKCKGDFYMTS